MCGIAGYSGHFTREALAGAGEQLAHRGPDGHGIYQNEKGIGLVHRRLAIIDLSPSGAQPMSDPSGDLVITFNGEIYNYRELRAELAGRGVQFRTQSDTEVLLQLYQAEGEAMIGRLNGIFTFGLWDARRGSLLIARDALGVKPLYYSQNNRGVAFASEIKALLCLVPEARTLDPEAVDRYLAFLCCPGAGTPFRDIRKLNPGEAMTVRDGQIARQWPWYRLPQFAQVAGPMDPASAERRVIDGLRRAVERQLVADVPVGAFLSGGLDSSAVVAMAREQVAKIRCFTIEAAGAQDDGFVDDLPYAKQVAGHLDVPLDVVTVDAASMAADIETMIWHLDEPLADPAALNVLYISQLARRHGITVLLSGTGGDDLFSGYRRHAAIRYQPLWRWLPQGVRFGLDRAAASLDQRRARGRRLNRLMSGAGLNGDAHLANTMTWIRTAERRALFTAEFRDGLQRADALAPMVDFLKPLPPRTTDLDRALVLEQRFYLADHNLLYTDKMAMAAGVEVRVPFLDPDLVALAAAMPDGLKQRGTVGKWILKRALRPFLPADIIDRPKAGFGAPLRRWMRGPLRPLMADALSVDALRRRGIFEPAAVHRLIARNDSGAADAAYPLFAALCFEIWCRQFLDGTRPEFSASPAPASAVG